MKTASMSVFCKLDERTIAKFKEHGLDLTGYELAGRVEITWHEDGIDPRECSVSGRFNSLVTSEYANKFIANEHGDDDAR